MSSVFYSSDFFLVMGEVLLYCPNWIHLYEGPSLSFRSFSSKLFSIIGFGPYSYSFPRSQGLQSSGSTWRPSAFSRSFFPFLIGEVSQGRSVGMYTVQVVLPEDPYCIVCVTAPSTLSGIGLPLEYYTRSIQRARRSRCKSGPMSGHTLSVSKSRQHLLIRQCYSTYLWQRVSR